MKSSSIKELKQYYGVPPIGSFALEAEFPSLVKWDHCREQFAVKFTEELKGFFFSHAANKGKSVSEFFHTFEDIVFDVYEKKRKKTQFIKTNNPSVLWVQPSKFWKKCRIKRSLLTILLRSGANYCTDKKNFDDCLFFSDYKENQYIRNTKNAIMRFMFGFTEFVGKIPVASVSIEKHGWFEEFKNCDQKKVCDLLRFPEKEPKQKIFGVNCLWN